MISMVLMLLPVALTVYVVGALTNEYLRTNLMDGSAQFAVRLAACLVGWLSLALGVVAAHALLN
jgi:uncharacterized membrane protein